MKAPEADLDHVLFHTRGLWSEFRGAKILVTGGTGFFGAWLLESFVHVAKALGLDAELYSLSRNPADFRAASSHLASVTFLEGDVRAFDLAGRRFTHIIHAATDASAALDRDQPELMYATIVDGTRRVLEAASRCGEPKILLVSSGAVYGPAPVHVAEDAPPQPLASYSAYATGKREAEKFWSGGPIARCFAFVGPGLPLNVHFAAGNFIRDGLAGGPIEVKGDGRPRRSYLYAADLAIWLWTILARGRAGRAYNVGSEKDYSIDEIAKLVAGCFSPVLEVRIAGAPRPGAPSEAYVPSTARARAELGLAELVPLNDAVRRTVAWHQLSIGTGASS